jgi:hypothetical protein
LTTPGRRDPEPPPVGWPEDGPAYRPAAPRPGTSASPSTNPQPSRQPPPLWPDPPTRTQAPVPQATARQAPAPQRAMTVGPAPRKGGRRARLTVKRIDPWSTLKFSFVYSVAGLVVLLVAVIALYAIVDAMGVIDSIRSFLNDVEGNKSSIAKWLGFGRVMTIALVVGCVNVILFTAFATLTAFVYNVCTDLVGGIEVTLADRN